MKIKRTRKQNFFPKEIKVISFQRDSEGKFMSASFFLNDDRRMFDLLIEKTEILLIPDKVGTQFNVFFKKLQ